MPNAAPATRIYGNRSNKDMYRLKTELIYVCLALTTLKESHRKMEKTICHLEEKHDDLLVSDATRAEHETDCIRLAIHTLERVYNKAKKTIAELSERHSELADEYDEKYGMGYLMGDRDHDDNHPE